MQRRQRLLAAADEARPHDDLLRNVQVERVPRLAQGRLHALGHGAGADAGDCLM